MPNLAQNTDWIETIVVVAIIALSALKPVATFLIRKFTPPKDVNPRDPQRVQRQATHAPPERPKARPLPPRPRPVVAEGGTTPKMAVPIPEPLRDILTELIPELVPPRARQSPDRTAAPPPAQPRVQPPRVRATSRRKRRDTSSQRPDVHPAPRSPHTADYDGIDSAALPSVEAEQTHPAPVAAGPTHDQALVDSGTFASVRPLSRQSLRVAIMMNEILGPPVAMRDAKELPG